MGVVAGIVSASFYLVVSWYSFSSWKSLLCMLIRRKVVSSEGIADVFFLSIATSVVGPTSILIDPGTCP